MPGPGPRSTVYVLVGDDGTFREVHGDGGTISETVDLCNTLVDGWIELVRCTLALGGDPDRRATIDLWLNEEGKMRNDFAPNPHALGLLHYATTDMFVGPVLIASSTHDGETVGLADEVVEAARSALLRLGATELPPARTAEAAAQQAATRAQRLELGYRGHGYYSRWEISGPGE